MNEQGIQGHAVSGRNKHGNGSMWLGECGGLLQIGWQGDNLSKEGIFKLRIEE